MSEVPEHQQELDNLVAENKALKAELTKIYRIIAHELGSPVNSLESMAGLMLADAQQEGVPPMLTATADYLHQQVLRLQKQMANLIALANLKADNWRLNPLPLSLSEEAAGVVEALKPIAAQKGIGMVAEWPAGTEPAFIGDSFSLRFIVQNLLSNAVKFSRKGDQIQVRMQTEPLAIVISDTGIGMGKAKLASVADISRPSVQRGTANEAGLGLGLALSLQVATLNGWQVELRSEQGKGTTATLSF